MSGQDAKAITARFVDAFNAHDVDASVGVFNPECVVVAQRSAFEGAFRGHDGVRRWLETYWEAVPDVQTEVERLLEGDDGRVVVLGRQWGTSKLGGAPFDAPLAMEATIEEGLVTSVTAYASHADALEATGLAE